MKLQRFGGYCSLAHVGAFLFLLISVITSAKVDGPAESMAAAHASPIGHSLYYLAVFFIGTLTLLISLALRERMNSKYPNLMFLSVIAGAMFCAMYLTMAVNGAIRLSLTEDDLLVYKVLSVLWSNASRVAYTAWGFGVIMIGYAAIKTRLLPRILGGILILQGILLIPSLFIEILIGGPVGIITNLWLGIYLLLNPEPNSPT